MDSDGQHPPELIPQFMAKSSELPQCMILGVPVFDDNAPSIRVQGRKISHWWANVETLWAGIGDSLFGFRVSQIAPPIEIMRGKSWIDRTSGGWGESVYVCIEIGGRRN